MRDYLKHALALTVAFALVFSGGVLLGSRGQVDPSLLFAGSELPPEDVDFSPLWKAWRILEDKYIPATTTASLSREDMLWGALEGLAASYGDPYTVFLPPRESEIFEDDISGTFGGVGMEIGVREGVLTVIAPLKDTPAERAGILPGDIIFAIDGKSTFDMSVDEAVLAIRGEIGTEVVLTVLHEGAQEEEKIVVKRAQIDIPTIDTRLEDDGVFVIELYNFTATSPMAFREAVRAFHLSNAKRLVLDLRGNPGGFLEAAIDIASWWLPAGAVVVEEDMGDSAESRMHRSKGYGVLENVPTVVLINGGSASASEIVAGALADHGKAELVGQRTFGKGSVQELVHITPETSLKVTVARWLTPKGTSISAGGLAPDHEVEMTLEDIEAGRDPQFEEAFALIRK